MRTLLLILIVYAYFLSSRSSRKASDAKKCDIYNYFYLHKTQEKVLEVRYKTKSERE